MRGEAEFDMVSRHISVGDIALSRQLNLVQRLRASGSDTESAERLLELFESVQAAHFAHYARLIDGLA